MEPAFGFLSSRVIASTPHDWSNLLKIMPHMLGAKDEVLKLSSNYSQNLHWRTGAALGVLLHMRSLTDATLSIVLLAMLSSSTKQKVSSTSSKETELVVVDDKTRKVT